MSDRFFVVNPYVTMGRQYVSFITFLTIPDLRPPLRCTSEWHLEPNFYLQFCLMSWLGFFLSVLIHNQTCSEFPFGFYNPIQCCAHNSVIFIKYILQYQTYQKLYSISEYIPKKPPILISVSWVLLLIAVRYIGRIWEAFRGLCETGSLVLNSFIPSGHWELLS